MVKPENPRNYEGEYFLYSDLPLCVLQDYITNEVHEEWKFCAVKVKEESITTAGGTPGHFKQLETPSNYAFKRISILVFLS